MFRDPGIIATIATIVIVPILLMVPGQSFQGLSSLKTIKRHGSCLFGAEQNEALVPSLIFGRF